MIVLQVASNPFRAKHPAVEGKFFPRLEPDDFIFAHLELNAALLSAKAAVRFDEALRRMTRFVTPTPGRNGIQVRPELFGENFWSERRFSHELVF